MAAIPAPVMIFGQYGLEPLTYHGSMKGKLKGAVTGHWYEVTPERERMYVDKRDSADLLAMVGTESEPLFEGKR